MGACLGKFVGRRLLLVKPYDSVGSYSYLECGIDRDFCLDIMKSGGLYQVWRI
jgi:hypothetical protein